MTTVVHHRLRQSFDEAAGTYVYIGRPSKWGNPFAITRAPHERTREEAIALFTKWWREDAQAALRGQAIIELHDKTLGCWCHPRPCHGDVIAAYVNMYWYGTPR